MNIIEKTKALLLPLTNMGLRGIGLAGRFALSFYLIKYLPLDANGQFALVTGAVGVLPAALTFGINFFMLREIIGVRIDDAIVKVRDKIALTSTLSMSMFIIAILINFFYPINFFGNLILAGLIIIVEIIAFDLHYTLISLKKPLQANFLLVIRTSSWVFPFIALTYFSEQYRNIETLLIFWLSSAILSLLILYFLNKDWPWNLLLKKEINFSWISTTIKSAVLIYMSDIGIVIFSYFDRFFIAAKLGLEETAIYTFYWTLSNALLVLMTAAVTQVSLPALVESFKTGENEWRNQIKSMLRKSVIGCAIMGALLIGVTYLLLPFINNGHITNYFYLFPVMIISVSIRILSDMINYGLYSRNKDRTLAFINISSIAVSCILTVTSVSLFGLSGIVISMMGASLFLLFTRGFFLLKDAQRSSPQIFRP